MGMPLTAEVWNKAALTDNRLLPGRYSLGIFTGKDVNMNIANNEEAYAYDNILVSDRIFDYDDRRINGLANPGPDVHGDATFNDVGRDGWGASAYGPFQSVRFERRVFTSGQHKSIAWRIFDEKQYAGEINNFGTETVSSAYTGGENYLSTAETINKAKKIWDDEILGPHIDKYNFFAIANGHIAGRFVQTFARRGQMFDGEGQWIASPGPYAGLSYAPEFAPIKAVEWDALNVRPLLNSVNVAWQNLFIPPDNRVCLLDAAYRDQLLSNLIGIPGSTPGTDRAYDDLVEGRFERFYGWDFDFTIPSQYYPKVYLDANNNVVHTPTGTAAYDQVINSINAPAGVIKLQTELAESHRTRDTNYFGTVFNPVTKEFENILTNYPFSMPAGSPYLGVPDTALDPDFSIENSTLADFPWQGYPGSGPSQVTGPVLPITRRQVIGMFVYRPAAQLSQEYGNMETDRGGTRGKFTELVFDMKHDAWVIPNLSHGILLIVDSQNNAGVPALNVNIVDNTPVTPTITGITATPDTFDLTVGQTARAYVAIQGTGAFDRGYQMTIDPDDGSILVGLGDGSFRAVGAGTATVTYTAIGDPSQTVDVTVTVTA